MGEPELASLRITVAVVENSHSRHIRHKEMSWAEYVDWLGIDEPAAVKNTQGYVLGRFSKSTRTHKDKDDAGEVVKEYECNHYHRLAKAVESRCALGLDADHPGEGFLERVESVLPGVEAVWYTTYSSTVDSPRYRLVVPLDRPVSAEEYEHISLAVMQAIDGDSERVLPMFDPAGSRPNQLMYKPASAEPSQHQSGVLRGAPLVADEWLSVVVVGAEKSVRGAEKADPYDLPGVVGQFNLEYQDDWDRLIEEWDLPYERVEENAYILAGSTHEPGAGPVPGTGWWHSFHASDPAAEKTLTAFDLVRVHNFGGLDENVSALGFADLPSQGEMKRAVVERFGWVDHVVDREMVFGDLEMEEDDGAKVAADPNHPNPNKPLPNARKIQKEWEPLLYQSEDWYSYRAGVYQRRSDREIESRLWKHFEFATYTTNTGNGAKVYGWNPAPGTVSAVQRALAGISLIPDGMEPNTWMKTGVREPFVNCLNGLLHPGTGIVIPHSPLFYSTVQVPYVYDEAAQCPQWEDFLRDVLAEDEEQINLLQEWFGYILTGRLDLQKFLYLLGAKRSGKGTVLHILSTLLGRENIAAMTLDTYTAEFGLQGLIGKGLAVTADARTSKDTRIQTLTERLLTISAGDIIPVPRKFKETWYGVLPTRIVIASNDTPWFNDASGAVVSRMSLVRFRKSYLGREDYTLQGRLLTELSGILNWAMAGVDRLEERGRFTEPATSVDVLMELEDESSPVGAFVKERCVMGVEESVGCERLLEEYNDWLMSKGEPGVGSRAFGKMLRSAYPNVERRRVGSREDREYRYLGMALVEDLI